jgi:hypothetical protein
VLDEDGVFLLCSDGLSDYDRVEQFWQTEILPILDSRVDLTTAGERLIQIANTQNGHDNATVALLYCKVSHSKTTGQTERSVPQVEPLSTPIATSGQATISATPSRMKTQQLASAPSAGSPWRLLLGIVFLLGLGGVLAYVLVPGLGEYFDPLIKEVAANFNSSSEPISASPSPPPSPEPSPSALTSLDAPAVIQVTSSTSKNAEGKTASLLLRRGLPPQNQAVVGTIPAGSVLQIISKSADQQQEPWLQLRVCAPGVSNSEAQAPKSAKTTPVRPPSKARGTPAANSKPASVTYRQVEQGEGGWIKEADVLPSVNPSFTPTAAQRSACVTPATPAISSPTPKPT